MANDDSTFQPLMDQPLPQQSHNFPSFRQLMMMFAALLGFVLLADVCWFFSLRSIESFINDRQAQPESNIVPLFVFGDSMFDPGNNNYLNTTPEFQANFWPYGETFFNFPSGRFSNGRIVPDFIAEYADLPIIPPYLQLTRYGFTGGMNFASGGAGALVETHQGFVFDFKTQISHLTKIGKQWRETLGEGKAKKLFSKAVYLIGLGGNDYFTYWDKNTSTLYSKQEYVDMVIGNITAGIREIHKVGGRKFGIVSMGPIGCVPQVRKMEPNGEFSCNEGITELIKLHHKAFPKAMQQLENQLDGLKYGIHDFYTSLGDMIRTPSKYGLYEGKEACCGSGPLRGTFTCGGKRGIEKFELCQNVSEYLFFDSAHPSEKVYQHISELIWDGPPSVTGPYNLKTLFQI